MRTNTKTTNISLTPDISDYLDKRLSALEKLLTHDSEAAFLDIEIGRTTNHHQTGDVYKAEFTLHSGQKTFRALSETPDLYTSIDEAKDRIMDELRSEKGKRLSLLRRGGKQIKSFIKGFPWWKK